MASRMQEFKVQCIENVNVQKDTWEILKTVNKSGEIFLNWEKFLVLTVNEVSPKLTFSDFCPKSTVGTEL